MSWAWRQSVGNPIRKLVLLHFANCANPEHGNESWHAAATIAAACNCSRSAVFKHINALVDMGLLSLISQSQRKHETNRYRINIHLKGLAATPIIDGSPDGIEGSPGGLLIDQGSPGGRQGSPGGIEGSPGDTKTVIEPVIEPVSVCAESGDSDGSVKKGRAGLSEKQIHERIIGIYHDVLHDPAEPSRLLPKVRVSAWHGSPDAKALNARLKTRHYRNFNFWHDLFEIVARHDFWMHRTGSGGEWRGCNLRWIVKATNFNKIMDYGMSLGVDLDELYGQPETAR